MVTQIDMKDKVFYQDFLMEIPTTNDEFPDVELQYVESLEGFSDILDEYNLFDCMLGKIRTISFQRLHNMLAKNEWEHIFDLASKCDKVILIDDILIKNEEVRSIKEFYLKVYYLNLKKYNNNTYVCMNVNKT